MHTKDIQITCNIHCEGLQGEVYRLFLDNDLITERGWRWDTKTHYLQENVALRLLPGDHILSIAGVGSPTSFMLSNLKIERGAAKADFNANKTTEITLRVN